jgi:hypothetical protein
MVGPIQALRAGAERIGGGDFAQRIDIKTGDELEGLANQFNDMGARLQESYADLEKKVESRTAELSESLQFQTATADVLRVISRSPNSLQPVLDVIVDTSRHLCGTETTTVFLLSDGKFRIAAASGTMPEYLDFLRSNPIAIDQAGSSTARAAREKRTIHIPDISADPEFGQGPMAVGDRRALLSVPLMREGTAIGVITMRQSSRRSTAVRSRWWRPSPTRRSLPSRMCGCSSRCRNVPGNCRSRSTSCVPRRTA